MFIPLSFCKLQLSPQPKVHKTACRLAFKGDRKTPSCCTAALIAFMPSVNPKICHSHHSRSRSTVSLIEDLEQRPEWQGAEEMGQMELLLNVYAASKARGSIADFMGHCAVQPEEAKHRLTPGLWLVRIPCPHLLLNTHRQAAGIPLHAMPGL